MIDTKTLSYINMFAVLGSLENMCKLDSKAAELLTNKTPVSIAFSVKNGPQATFTFDNGRCSMKEGIDKCDIKLPFSSCEKFNGLIDGTYTPIPSKGFTKLGFLTKDFTKLTDRMAKYLRASQEDLRDESFYNISTQMMFYVVSCALSQIANHDKIGKFSASNTPDGVVLIGIKDGPYCSISVKDHVFTTIKEKPDNPRAYMEFASIPFARKLFEGTANTYASIVSQDIKIGGMISMIDNLNRILDRVGLYLA